MIIPFYEMVIPFYELIIPFFEMILPFYEMIILSLCYFAEIECCSVNADISVYCDNVMIYPLSHCLVYQISRPQCLKIYELSNYLFTLKTLRDWTANLYILIAMIYIYILAYYKYAVLARAEGGGGWLDIQI